MSSLELPSRSLAQVIIQASICPALNVISTVGNVLVCLAVYKNPKLRSNTNLYIIALAASDLLCGTVEMPLASAVLITARWNLGDVVCQLQGFLDVFVTNSTPATMGLSALNRYIRIVKTNHYNKVFSPRKCKVWLSFVWLSLALYLLIGRLTTWCTFEFIPGYAVCSVAFTTSENRIIHYCVMSGLFFVLPFSIGLFSSCKIFLKIHQHEVDVASPCTLSYVASGFLFCWILPGAFLFWKRFSPDTAPRIVQLTVVFLIYLSSTINPFIYAARHRVFRKEFRKLLCWWKEKRAISLADSGANRKRGHGEKTPESATPFTESLFSLPVDGKDRDQRNPENEVAETDL